MVERSMTRSSSSEQGGGLSLPPGFRFHPTDEEVITSYLLKKFLRPSFVSRAVGEVDLNNCEPRDLPSKAKMGEKEWYFFVHKDMKYPTGMRTNRATREGYWKATGKDREIFSSTNTKNKNPRAGSATAGELVGMKKTLVFYTGRAPRGAKTNWVMHEFRLDGRSRDQTVNNPKDEWVVCKVFNKKGEAKTTMKAAVDVDVDIECSAGTTTPNASSVVDAGEGAGDFLYFTNSEYSSSFLPVKTTTTTSTNAAAPPPYNADYYHYSVPTTAGSFNGAMPNYSLTNVTNQSHMQQKAAAVAKPVLPASSGGDIGSSWNILNPAGHGMERSSSYNVNHLHHHQHEHQAVMVKALGGVIGPNFGVSMGLPSSAAAIAGAPLQSKLESYDGEYAYGNYDLAGAAAAVNGRPAATAAKNFGARLLH